MTAQANDIFRLHGEEFSIAGISEGTLFEPEILDLQRSPNRLSTDCYRGYVAYFEVFEGHLVLDELESCLVRKNDNNDVDEHPIINGVTPEVPKNEEIFLINNYHDLKYHLEYSGGLLIADGFIRELYVHMGFHPAWKYTRVIELIFENGILQKEIDRSQQMAEIREKYVTSLDDTDCYGKTSDEEVMEFITRSFDRTYKMMF